LADWVGKAAFLLRPVHARLFERLKASTKLFADETTAPVLDPGRGRTKTGQLFAYARDDRPWVGSDPPGVAYLYAPDRKAEQTIRHLQGFVGTLQVDGYAGYKVLAERNAVSLAFCWSHVRRKFSHDHLSRAKRNRHGRARRAGTKRVVAENRGQGTGIVRRSLILSSGDRYPIVTMRRRAASIYDLKCQIIRLLITCRRVPSTGPMP